MPFENEEFETLYHQAKDLREAARFDDAATLYERALWTRGGTEEERFWAKFDLGGCLGMRGRWTEALALFGEVYVATRDRTEFHELAYRSFSSQIAPLMAFQMAEGTDENHIYRQLELVEEGMRWLRDIGREEWRGARLLQRSQALVQLGEIEQALDAAEEAYRVQKEFDGPGPYLGDYAIHVALYASMLGHYERALQVLDEVEGSNMDTYHPSDAVNRTYQAFSSHGTAAVGGSSRHVTAGGSDERRNSDSLGEISGL